jgi:hypothetical protein
MRAPTLSDKVTAPFLKKAAKLSIKFGSHSSRCRYVYTKIEFCAGRLLAQKIWRRVLDDFDHLVDSRRLDREARNIRLVDEIKTMLGIKTDVDDISHVGDRISARNLRH